MLQPHSLLWHYLWLGPHILQVGLAVWLVRRGLHKVLPVFTAYLLFEGLNNFTLYAMDILPSVTVQTFWRSCCVGLVVRSEEHTSELQSLAYLVCRLLLAK